MLENKEFKDALNKFAKDVVSRSRANLTKSDKNVSKKLYNSLGYEVDVKDNSFRLAFEMEEYGDYQDKGVKGARSSTKAPNSPYRFGSGTGKVGGLSSGILKWVMARRFQFRDRKTGKLKSYKETADTITHSVYMKGIKPSLFFTKPFESAFEKLPNELVEKYGLDVETFLKFTLERQ